MEHFISDNSGFAPDDTWFAAFGLEPEVAAPKPGIKPHGDDEIITLDLSNLQDTEDYYTQDLMHIIETLPLGWMQTARHTKAGPGQLCTQEFLTSIGVMDCPLLHGTPFKAVKKAINTLLTTFRADSEGGLIQEQREGAYMVTGWEESNRIICKRYPTPNCGWVAVTPESTFKARLVACALKQSYTSQFNPDENKVVQHSVLLPSNAMGAVPTNDRALILIGAPLLQKAKKKNIWIWEAIVQSYAAKGKPMTGMSLLYFAYRNINVPFDPLVENVPDVPVVKALQSINTVSIDRGKIQGLLDQSVWRGGSPTPSSQVIGSFLEHFLPTVPLRGHIASDVATWVTRRTMYVSSVTLPDPAGKVLVVPTDPRDMLNGDGGLFWGPSQKQLGQLHCSGIAVPISSPVSAATLVLRWMTNDANYRVGVSYGPNPALWAWKTAEKCLSKRELGNVLERLAASALWMPIYNMTQHFLGKYDVWAVVFGSDGFTVARTDNLVLYRYVPVQATVQTIIPVANWDESPLSFQGNDPSANKVFLDPRTAAAAPGAKVPRKNDGDGNIHPDTPMED